MPAPNPSGNHSPLMPRMVLDGKYRIVKVLGEGAMGYVYMAREIGTGTTWAVKVILPKLLARVPKIVERFRREYLTGKALDHPHIVRIPAGGFDAARDLEYLVMEFVEGIDCYSLVKPPRDPLPVADACELARQAAMGLQYAHKHKAVHRDIKPSNLMLTRQGIVKLLDLGLMHYLHDHPDGCEPLTTAGRGMGTPQYGAPEQWRDAHTAGCPADIYSLACTLFHFLKGEAPNPDPFLTRRGDPFYLQVDTLTADRPDVPADLLQLLREMGHPDQEDRIQTAQEVIARLQSFCEGHALIDLLPPPRPELPDLAVCYRRQRFHPLAKRLCQDLTAKGFQVLLNPLHAPEERTDLAAYDGNQVVQLVVATAGPDDLGIDDYPRETCVLRLNRDDAGACQEWDDRYEDEFRQLLDNLEGP